MFQLDIRVSSKLTLFSTNSLKGSITGSPSKIQPTGTEYHGPTPYPKHMGPRDFTTPSGEKVPVSYNKNSTK